MAFIVQLVQCRGTPFEIGRQQARLFLRTSRGIAFARRRARPVPAWYEFDGQRRVLEKFAPLVWQEIMGLAEGLHVPVETATFHFGNGGVRPPLGGCSAVMASGVYARNYDYRPRHYGARFALVQPQGSHASIGATELLTGRLDGMNEHGLCVGLHLVRLAPRQRGLSPLVIVRLLLDQCATTAQAVALSRRLPHGLRYNYSILDTQGDAAVVEAAPNNLAVREGAWLACTNHFQAPLMRSLNLRADHSVKRLPRSNVGRRTVSTPRRSMRASMIRPARHFITAISKAPARFTRWLPNPPHAASASASAAMPTSPAAAVSILTSLPGAADESSPSIFWPASSAARRSRSIGRPCAAPVRLAADQGDQVGGSDDAAMAKPTQLDRHASLRRGLFRLWLVLSAIFLLGVTAVSFDSLRREFDRAELLRFMAAQPEPLLPLECARARGVEGSDYTRAPPSPGERYRLMTPPATCWYKAERLRALYPDYAGLDDRALAERLYGAIGIPLKSPPQPFVLGLRVALLALGAPLLTLALGSALLWAAAGFLGSRD